MSRISDIISIGLMHLFLAITSAEVRDRGRVISLQVRWILQIKLIPGILAYTYVVPYKEDGFVQSKRRECDVIIPSYF